MRLERKVAAGLVILLVAAAATGGALAASGQGTPAAGPIRLTGISRGAFLRATAVYLGTDVGTLRRERTSGHRTLASIVNATPGRSTRQLSAGLAAAAIGRLELAANRALSNEQTRSLRVSLRRAIAGFLNDTCPLGNLAQDLGGCANMAPA